MMERTLFDTPGPTMAEAKTAADDGIQRAMDHEEAEQPGWHERALKFVEAYLRGHDTLHVDDLWTAGLPSAVSGRALGGVIRAAVANNWLEPIRLDSGDFRARPSRNSRGGLKLVWRSKLYGKQERI